MLPTAPGLAVGLLLLPSRLSLSLSSKLLLRVGWAAANGLSCRLCLRIGLALCYDKPQLALRRTLLNLLLADWHLFVRLLLSDGQLYCEAVYDFNFFYVP